ncbi:MAG: formyltransferase family protein [Desulfovibrio sp.]
MSTGAHPADLASQYNIPYTVCAHDSDIPNTGELFILLGAGLLSKECVRAKKIINCHSGLIPSSRGLDSFKWAIHFKRPLGITLHYIDENIDAGEIISTIETPILKSDSLETLAKRHYELEINALSHFESHISSPEFVKAILKECLPTMRMPIATEQDIISDFKSYKNHFLK